MPLRATYPSFSVYPSASVYPRVPAYDAETTFLVGSNGTRVPVLACLSVEGSEDTNTSLHVPRGSQVTLVDLNPWTAPQFEITLLLTSYQTFLALRQLYRSGAVVTLNDPGSPWDGLRHVATGQLEHRSVVLEGRPALIECSLEVIQK